MFLLVPAHPGFPGQIPQSRKTVVCVCEWKDNVENWGTRVNVNKTKVLSGERQKLMQKVQVLVVIYYNVLVIRSGYTRSVVV